jgi:predicted lipid-binding transport protein (Tim44 family)
MKKFLMALVISAVGLTLGMSSVEAKRLGGGGSFGKSSPSYSRQAPAQNNQAVGAATKPQPAAPSRTPWGGIIGGALLGLGIGALFSHFGMGAELSGMLGTMLMVGLLAFGAVLLFRLLSKKSTPAMQPAYPGVSERSMTPEIGSNIGQGSTYGQTASAAVSGVPADFDTTGFLRQAKSNFIRMQAAWDKSDTNDIREFTTPEMFAELKMQLTERGAETNHTDVVSLEAELLGIDQTDVEYLASVRFSGMVKESEHAQAEAFREVWILSKPVTGNMGWLLAGIQQN